MNPNHNADHSAGLSRICSVLRARGAFAFRLRGGLGMVAGLPDIAALLPPDGRFLAVELKTGRG